MARGQKIGLTLGSMDAFVAATAEAHNLTLATRNVKDFQRLRLFPCSIRGSPLNYRRRPSA
jgi:predicted nucleic acid-binding protein